MSIMQLTLFIMSLCFNGCKVESLQSPTLSGVHNLLTVHKQPSGCLGKENIIRESHWLDLAGKEKFKEQRKLLSADKG